MLEKIQNGGRSLTLDGHSIFNWLITFLGLRTKLFSNIGYAAKLQKNLLRNLTFVVQFAYFSIRPKSFSFFEQLKSNFRYKKQLLVVLRATFGEITGDFSENLEQFVETPIYGAFF